MDGLFRARGRKVNDAGSAPFQLRKAQSIYGDDSANIDIVTENTFMCGIYRSIKLLNRHVRPQKHLFKTKKTNA